MAPCIDKRHRVSTEHLKRRGFGFRGLGRDYGIIALELAILDFGPGEGMYESSRLLSVHRSDPETKQTSVHERLGVGVSGRV